MKITLLHIISFGGLNNYEITLEDGVNVLYGANETGKSSIAMFIKFLFYGLSAKAVRGAELSERERYINRMTGQAAGFLLLETDDGTEYRIERAIFTSDDAPARERVRIINRATGESFTGQNPGEYFFGVSEDVFLNTCFVGQSLPSSQTGSGTRPRIQALENLLTSADESVDIQKAVRTIDNVRREICHKNGNGGELNELRERRAALAEEIRQSSGTSAEIIRVTASLNDIRQRIAELTEDRQRYEGICASLDKVLLRRRLANAEQIQNNITALRKMLAELDSSALGTGFSEAVDEAERDIRAYAEACAACASSEGSDAFPDDDPPAPSKPTYTAESPDAPAIALQLEHRAHTQFTAVLVFFLAGLFGFAAALLLYSFNTDIYILPLLLTLASVTLGVVFLILHSRSSTALNNLLGEWDVASIEELEQLFTDPPEDSSDESEDSDSVSEETPDQPLLLQAKERFEAALAKIMELCRAAGIEPSDNLDDTLNALRTAADDIRADRDTMTEKLANLTGKLELLTEQLAGVDPLQAEYEYNELLKQPYGQTAAALSAEEMKTVVRERDFTNSALRSAEKRCADLETQLAALGSPVHTPEEAATALDELDRRIEELSLRHDACELAKTALQEASGRMRSGILPKIASNASILLSGATSGTHEHLTLDSSFSAGCSTATDILPGEYLSRGTSDLAYIALRIALAEEIFSSETPFMLFDESFSHIDASRIQGIVSLLLDGQHLILTCRREEAEAAGAGGAVILEMK